MFQDHGTPSTGDLDHGVFLLSRVEGKKGWSFLSTFVGAIRAKKKWGFCW